MESEYCLRHKSFCITQTIIDNIGVSAYTIILTGVGQNFTSRNSRFPEIAKPTEFGNTDYVDWPRQCVRSNGWTQHSGGSYI